MPRLGEPVPAFEAMTTKGEDQLPGRLQGQMGDSFQPPCRFHPDLHHRNTHFRGAYRGVQALNCELVGLSVDSRNSHIAWLKTIREKIEYKGMKDVKVGFPIIDDVAMKVASALRHDPARREPDRRRVRAVALRRPKGVCGLSSTIRWLWAEFRRDQAVWRACRPSTPSASRCPPTGVRATRDRADEGRRSGEVPRRGEVLTGFSAPSRCRKRRSTEIGEKV